MTYKILIDNSSKYFHLKDIVKALAEHIDKGLSCKVRKTSLKMLDHFEPYTNRELEAFTVIIKYVKDNLSSPFIHLQKEIATIENLRQSIIFQLKPKDPELQIRQLNSGQIQLEVLLKGYTAEEAVQWIVDNPAAINLEIADFRNFILHNLNNECLDKLTEACRNLRHLFIGHYDKSKIFGDALKYLERLPHLISLDISGCILEPDAGKHLKHVPDLQILHAKLTRIDLMKYLHLVSKLKILNLSNTEITSLDNLKFLPDLLHLLLDGCRKLEPNAFKDLVHVSKLEILQAPGFDTVGKYLHLVPNLLKLKVSWERTDPHVLENLKHTPNLKTLIIHGSHSFPIHALNKLVHVPKLEKLSIQNCAWLTSTSLEPLKFNLALKHLDFRGCDQVDPYVLKPLIGLPHLKIIRHCSKEAFDIPQLQLLSTKDIIAPLDQMTDWGNFIVRDPNWNTLSMYNTKGTQEPYGRRMQQAITVVTDLIKNNASFAQVCSAACAFRKNIAFELKHHKARLFGTPRDMDWVTDLSRSLYRDVGRTWQQKDLEFRKTPSLYYNYRKAMKIGYIHGMPIELSRVELQSMEFYHTNPKFIKKIKLYTEELYHKILNETDPLAVQEAAGLFFWWMCEGKFWGRGEPSISEIIFRSIFASKNIPNHPWKEKIVPWGEATKAFDPSVFSKNFPSLFDKTQ